MIEGIAAPLGAALGWACGATLLAAQTGRVDTLSLTFFRMVWAFLFLLVALFALDAQGDLGRMSAGDLAQLAGAGFLATGSGEIFYAAALPFIGLTPTFTIVMGLTVFSAFVLGAIFLGDAVSVQIGIGSAIVLVGVYVVAIYGRAGRRPVGQKAPAEGALLVPFLGRPRPWLLAHRWQIGIAMAALTGLMFGIWSVWTRSAAEGFDATAAAFVRMPPVVALLAAAALLSRESTLRRRAFRRRSLGLLAISGLIGTGAPTLLLVLGLQHASAGQVTVLFSTAPLFALPLAAIFLRERVTIWVVMGAVLALVGIVLIAI